MSAIRKLSKALLGDERRPSGESTPPRSHSHSPSRKSLAQVLHRDREYISSSDYDSSEYDSDSMSKNAQKRMVRKQRLEAKSKLSLDSRDESEDRAKQRLEEAAKNETEEMKSRYGQLPLMQSTTRTHEPRINLDDITDDTIGKEVTFRARLQHVRAMGTKLAFMIFRQQLTTIQGVLFETPGLISPVMLHWAVHLNTGNIMRVQGVVQKPEMPVKSASIHHAEIKLTDLKIVVRRAEPGKLRSSAPRAASSPSGVSNSRQCHSRCKKPN